MILTVDVGNTRIKAAVLRRISSWHFVFMKEEPEKNIENILKNLKNTSFGCCVG
jgi:type III pantothenate kinase